MATTTYFKDVDIKVGNTTNSYLIEPSLSGNATYSNGVYTVALDSKFAYINGVAIQVKIMSTNATAATLAVNSLTAKNIYYENNTLVANTLKANHTYTFVYKTNLNNDAGGWELVGDIDTNTNTTYTFANGTNGFTVTPSGGTAQTVTVTPSITNNVTGSGTSGSLVKFNGANTITNGPALGTDTKKFLNNKGEWSTPTPADIGAASATTVNGLLAAADAMLFKGTLGTGGTITAVPDGTSGKEYQAGYTYKIITAGTYANIVCEVGDLLIAIADSTSDQTAVNNAHWTVAQTNIDGAITGPASVTTTGNIAIFDGTTGKIIKDSGTTIANATVAKAGAANLTTTTDALAYYTNTTGTFGNASKITVYNNIDITVQNATKKRNGLRLSGTCYGNTAADLTSNTAGVMRYEDGGVRIEFSADSNDNAALLYTNHDSANTGGGSSFHFVGQTGSNNTGGNLAVTAPDFVARRRLMVGKNFTDTNYVFYSNGATYINGATTINSNLDITAGTIYFGKSATNKAILAYNSNNTKFGIWYHEGDTDVMRFSASGNADSNTTADFAINALGAGILSNRNNYIPHTGNTTGSVGGTTTPVYVDDGQIKALSYTIEKSVPSNAVFTDHYAWGDITSKPTSIALTGAVTANATTLGSGAISITTTVNHGHGYISSTGQITETHQIANGDRLIVTDSANATTADKNKLIATTIAFDGSTATKALTQKGTWETFNNYSHPTDAGNKHIPSGGSTGQFLKYGGSSGTATWSDLPTASSDTAGITKIGASGGAAAYSHTHSVADLTWGGGVNLKPTATANNQEWSIDLTPGSYTGTLWHVWSAKQSATILGCYTDDRHVTMPGNIASTSTSTGTLQVTGGIGATGQVTALRLAANGSNTSYSLYVNGSSLFNGSVKLGSIQQAITGTGTTASDAGSGDNRYKPALWKFNLGIATPTTGDMITVTIPCAGHSYGVFVSTDNGTTYYPVSVGTGTSRLTTHYANTNIVTLFFDGAGSTADMYPVVGATSRSTITGGCWRVLNYYDSGNTNTATRQKVRSTNANYSLLFADPVVGTADNNTNYYTYRNDSIYVNPSTGNVYATTFNGALIGNADTATKATQDGSGNTITTYYCTLSTAQTFTGNKTFNAICYFANGTTYYVNNSAEAKFLWLDLARTSNHGLSVGTIRGKAYNNGTNQTGEYIHMYDRVHIGSPKGWGSRNAPQYGLSTYGGCSFATDTGDVEIWGGLEVKGHIAGDSSTTGHGLYSGGAYHNGYNNIILHGDGSTGSSGIAFVSDKVNRNDKTLTTINQPSDRAFIQYHACGVTTLTAEGTAPTIATSGEVGRLVIGVGNDAGATSPGDQLYLQTKSNVDLLHLVVGSTPTLGVIPDTGNTTGSVGGTNQPVYIEGGIIKACTAYSSASVASATTCSYPAGFNGRNTNATWGNQTGTTVTCWGEANGGSIDFRCDNPSSGKLSIKVDGRFYGNEGTYPTMLMRNENNFWGLCDPDAANNVWIRTTTQGIIPYQAGNEGSGHCGLGTSSWYFSNAYVDTAYNTKVIIKNKVTLQWNDTDQSLDFVFA